MLSGPKDFSKGLKMSRKVRNGSPTSPNCLSKGGSCASGVTSSLSGSGPQVVSLFNRLLPLKATVPFQLKTQLHQSILMSNRLLHSSNSGGNGGVGNPFQQPSNNNGNSNVHEVHVPVGGVGTCTSSNTATRSPTCAPTAGGFTFDATSVPAIPLFSPCVAGSGPVECVLGSQTRSSPSPFLHSSPYVGTPSMASQSSSSSSSSSSSLSSSKVNSVGLRMAHTGSPLPAQPATQQLTSLVGLSPNHCGPVINFSVGPLVALTGPGLAAPPSSALSPTQPPRSPETASPTLQRPCFPTASSSSSPSSCVSLDRRDRGEPHHASLWPLNQDPTIPGDRSEGPGRSPHQERPRLTLPPGPPPSSSSSSMRRTSSLDTLTAPYLAGHWPREAGHAPSRSCGRDKATQTPSVWDEECQASERRRRRRRRSGEHDGGRRGSHRRSASWGSTGQLKEIAKLRQQLQRGKHSSRCHRDKSPFNGNHGTLPQSQQVLCPRTAQASLSVCRWPAGGCRRSVEGLNQEIERLIIREATAHPDPRRQDVPDGRRAPPPLLPHSPAARHSSRTVDTQTFAPSADARHRGNGGSPSVSPPASPTAPFEREGEEEEEEEERERKGETEEDEEDGGDPESAGPGPYSRLDQGLCPVSPLPGVASSPKPNNSLLFQREPPEGCEKIRVFTDETLSMRPQLQHSVLLGCPDRNKVNFIPNNSGSAFCLVTKSRLAPPTASSTNRESVKGL